MDLRKYLGKTIKIKIDMPLGTRHPKYDLIYPVNYGFVPGTKNDDGEEIDVYVLGAAEPLSKFEGRVIAVIERIDDNDDKLVAAPEGLDFSEREIAERVEFQEKYFKSRVVRG